jgi:hypothetical protein
MANLYQKNSSLRFLVLIVRFSCQTNSGDVKCPKQYNFKIFLKNFDPSGFYSNFTFFTGNYRKLISGRNKNATCLKIKKNIFLRSNVLKKKILTLVVGG